MTKYLICIFSLLAGFNAAYGQQQVMFTQYMFNGLAINPAYAGSHESISMSLLAREQWTGLDGAPSTQTFAVHTPFVNQRIGLGLLVLHDKIGVTEQTGTYASYSYKIPFENGSNLAFGVQAGLTSFNAKFSEVSSTDPTFSNGDIKELHPAFGFGMYYSNKRMYAGLSIPQLNQRVIDGELADSDSKLVRHYFGTFGYLFTLNQSLKLKPSVLLKVVKGAPAEMDFNANLIINDVLWLGLSYRSFDSFDALFQVQVTNKLQIGYSYDLATSSEIRRINSGSHEFMLHYLFSFDKKKIVTPRYF